MAQPKRKNPVFTTSDAEEVAAPEMNLRSPRVPMPVGAFRQAARSVHKTSGSERANKRYSLSTGGMHRRRNKRSF